MLVKKIGTISDDNFNKLSNSTIRFYTKEPLDIIVYDGSIHIGLLEYGEILRTTPDEIYIQPNHSKYVQRVQL
ncbi:MAG: hypothetical protein KAS04_04765, partial [Candidatus Aenigmarchaeota archaeon]|nr:hypothetical protein [Candidatus Aenigmarchaeota archaeon]